MPTSHYGYKKKLSHRHTIYAAKFEWKTIYMASSQTTSFCLWSHVCYFYALSIYRLVMDGRSFGHISYWHAKPRPLMPRFPCMNISFGPIRGQAGAGITFPPGCPICCIVFLKSSKTSSKYLLYLSFCIATDQLRKCAKSSDRFVTSYCSINKIGLSTLCTRSLINAVQRTAGGRGMRKSRQHTWISSNMQYFWSLRRTVIAHFDCKLKSDINSVARVTVANADIESRKSLHTFLFQKIFASHAGDI